MLMTPEEMHNRILDTNKTVNVLFWIILVLAIFILVSIFVSTHAIISYIKAGSVLI